MVMIESKHIDVLFTELPQYGLRGNSALWEMLKETLNETEKQFTGEQLIEWVLSFTRNNMITSLINEIENRTGYPTNWSVLSEYGYQENL
ncbi:metallophosphoesterase, partial [Vibrio genomosp. F10]